MSLTEPTAGEARPNRAGILVDVLFGLVVAGTAGAWYRAQQGGWFFADEWAMAEQVRSPGGLFEAYNSHLSVLILGLYRALLEVFGFGTYVPYRLAGVVSLAAVSVAVYVLVRHEVGRLAAVVAGALLLWPRGITVEPGGLNHSLAAVGAVVCAAGLVGRGRRRDLAVAAGLAFALASAGGGVAVAAAALVHSACTRAGRARWAAVLVPTATWLLWYLAIGGETDPAVAAARPDIAEIVRIGFEQWVWSFSALTLGNRVGGVVVALVVLVVLVDRLRGGLAAAAGTIAWMVALGFWWLGLAWSRWLFIDIPTFRYDFTTMVFVILALLPTVDSRARPGPTLLQRYVPAGGLDLATRPWAAPVALVVVLAATVPTVRVDLDRWGDLFATAGGASRDTMAAISLGPDAVPGDAVQGFPLGALTARQLRTLATVYPSPPGWDDPTAYLDVMVTPSAAREATDPCRGRVRTSEATVRPNGRPVVTAPERRDVTVLVGRFGEEPAAVVDVPAGRSVELVLDGAGLADPWTVQAPAGCVTPG